MIYSKYQNPAQRECFHWFVETAHLARVDRLLVRAVCCPSLSLAIEGSLIREVDTRRFHLLLKCFEKERVYRHGCQHWFRCLVIQSRSLIGLSNKARTSLYITASIYFPSCMSDRVFRITEMSRRQN